MRETRFTSNVALTYCSFSNTFDVNCIIEVALEYTVRHNIFIDYKKSLLFWKNAVKLIKGGTTNIQIDHINGYNAYNMREWAV